MENVNEIAVCDFARLAVLDLAGIVANRTERIGNRFWAYFPESKAKKVMDAFENGTLKVVARDYDAALRRTKDRIFNSERQLKIRV